MINYIVPTPKKTELTEGVTSVPLTLCLTVPEWEECAKTLTEAFKKLFKVTITRADGGIIIKKDTTLPSGTYTLDSRDGIVLSASDSEGIFYAAATLLQAVSVKENKALMSRVLIEDYPEKDFRGLMIDLAREWHPAYTVHQYIDVCFMLKIKYLHLHFIDNERYTLPSLAFPKLNEGDSYTYDEIVSMREHAKARGVIIIPEFEAPGHAKLLSVCYPEVFANETEGEADTMLTENGIVISDKSIICAGKAETMDGIKVLLRETCELFPDSPYIHIGGDEANINVWNNCPTCKKYMAENGITDVHELYSEFVGRTAESVIEMGKRPIVWEGFPKKGSARIPKQTIVIAWESLYHLANELIEEGFTVINASWVPTYIVPAPEMNWGTREILDWNVYNWQHWYKKSFAYEKPINVEPTEQVIGAEICVWESTFELEISKTINNLAALSERTWTVARLWNDMDFINRAKPTLLRIGRYIQTV